MPSAWVGLARPGIEMEEVVLEERMDEEEEMDFSCTILHVSLRIASFLHFGCTEYWHSEQT